MKISEQWLRTWVNPALSTTELVAQLTMAGLEVESVTPVAGDFTHVMIGEIVSAEQHPNADRLRVTQVNVGAEAPIQIVCGGANARPGIRVAVAMLGADLPGGIHIKKTALRGVDSFGMLCGARELGLPDTGPGIMELPLDAPLGTDIREYLELNDSIIDVDLTPNRGDCASVLGLAREICALNQLSLTRVPEVTIAPTITNTLPIDIQAPAACPRYLGRVIKGVDVSRPTPAWLVQRLERSGIRSIDPVVDVTNYVLIEMGQPLHAFDADKIQGGIQVRLAKEGEPLTLLDGKTINLNADVLVIADATQALAFAGALGGASSAVTATTRNIFLEVAFFAPQSLAGRARRFGIQTEGGYRFERGVDPQVTAIAMERATALLLAIAGGEAGPVSEVIDSAYVPTPRNIEMRRQKAERLLGFSLTEADIITYFKALDFSVTIVTPEERYSVTVPTHRFDITIEQDLIEELARLYGYDRIPALALSSQQSAPLLSEQQISVHRLRACLVDRGYHEAITYSFVDPKWQQALLPELEGLALVNPISEDLSLMRTSLWASLLPSLAHNQRRQQERVRLFEIGLRFLPSSAGVTQQAMLAGVVSGSQDPLQWSGKARPTDFYDVKADVEALLALAGRVADWQFIPAPLACLHPGQSASLHLNGKAVGWIGSLHPRLLATLDLTGPVWMFEIDLQSLQASSVPVCKPISKFPAIRRDISFTVGQSILASHILSAIKAKGGDWLQDVTIFDVYQGPGIAAGHKSMALALILQENSRTLTDAEVEQWQAQIVQHLQSTFAIQLRDGA
jgi:phenylalanyl-tRNA synthetase beta chain